MARGFDHIGTAAGDGNDRITLDVALGADQQESATNLIWCGAGDDTVLLTAHVNATGLPFPQSLNEIVGGTGNDRLEIQASQVSNHGYNGITNRLSGGDGNNSVIGRIESLVDDGNAVFRNEVRGDGGDDLVAATILPAPSVPASSWIDARNVVSGGSGSDNVAGRIEITVEDRGTAINTLQGGTGDDTLDGLIVITLTHAGPAGSVARNFLRGGSGNDDMRGEIDGDVIGWSWLIGDDGADTLVAVGGTGNVLDGGAGADRLTGSATADRMVGGLGDDAMDGGGGADNFQFFVARNDGRDTITGFQRAADLLVFTGLADGGVAGLADDLAAITEVEDAGVGGDVVVTFESGSVLVFAGLGTGAINSLADLVSDPSTQLANSLLV